LHKNPNQVNAFWDYYFVQLKKLNLESVAKKTDPNWEQLVRSFKSKSGKGTQPRWAPLNLVQVAKDVGLDDNLHHAYYLPNLFIHSSSAELLFSLEVEQNGSISPVDFNSRQERSMADVAFMQGWWFLLRAIDLAVDHYGWSENESIVKSCADN